MGYLDSFLLTPNPLHLFRIFNLIVAGFGALMMFRMKTETSTRELPWTKHLGIALSIFALQYLVFSLGLDQKTELLLHASNGFVWSELFGIPINLFLLSAGRILLNRGKHLPRWFLLLVAIDLLAVILSLAHFANYAGHDYLSTFCRLAGDGISFITLMYFGYASYINTRFYRNRTGFVLGIVIGVIYGGIHLISPFTPNIAFRYASLALTEKQISERIGTIFTFVAALFKLALLYFAFLITTLETQTLITLRSKLREQVDSRKVFFSRQGILEAIINAFQADAVRLYIKVTPTGDAKSHHGVHIYSAPSEKESEYEIRSESETPLPDLVRELVKEHEEANRFQTERAGGSFLKRIFQASPPQPTRPRFSGVESIRYHGGLIGCLTIEKHSSQKFTYSAERLCRILSEDISALVQFYRVEESLRVLSEGLNKNLETLSSAEINSEFEVIIQRVLSPLRTRFVINTGFQTALPANSKGSADNSYRCKTVPYRCVADEARDRVTIGEISLDYQKERDPVAAPSLGYWHAYGEAVASIVTRSFLSCVEQKFNLIIRTLSLELTKTLDFDKWFEQIQHSVLAAEFDGVVFYYPEIRGFRQLIRRNDSAENIAVGQALTNAFPDPKKVLEQLADSPTVIPLTSDKVILGIKLASDDEGHSRAGLFIGVKRLEFAKELGLNTPWRNFLLNFANVAGNAFERVIHAMQIQKNQIAQAEDYMILATAEKIGLITHELLSHIENLAGNAGLLKLDLPESLEEAPKKALDTRLKEMSLEFEALRSLAGGIRSSAQIPKHSGPSSLQKTLRKLASLHELRSNIEIELKGVKNLSAHPGSATALSEVKVALPRNIVELTFGNLIRNSIAAIKRQVNGENKSAGSPGLIRIWAEVEDGNNFIDCFINDNGSGVPPGMVDSIFEVNVSSTPGHGGWGLFYVKRKLERDGGSINVQHSEPGNTTFRVRLPRFFNKAI